MIKNKNQLTTFKKIILYILACIFLLYLGLIIGYSILGKGKVIDALDFEALKHIKDIINK